MAPRAGFRPKVVSEQRLLVSSSPSRPAPPPGFIHSLFSFTKLSQVVLMELENHMQKS
ncbi:hydroxysteroid 17-beta dehydrogenase 12 [Homo sapiens]|uniref:Hydroxysteroid 17-beta dehydrogenase 12 n=1 Tax=Homo sapiens TaxID=9606 RepID=A0A1B0GW27_HUMAN|nr:hydroxysteroid 17-beta dehydrogenase 12 [Homo sapiens]KAI4070838.1 hydroxysteroid 17-beta dehydrogenase 12 [Homo sapiens]